MWFAIIKMMSSGEKIKVCPPPDCSKKLFPTQANKKTLQHPLVTGKSTPNFVKCHAVK